MDTPGASEAEAADDGPGAAALWCGWLARGVAAFTGVVAFYGLFGAPIQLLVRGAVEWALAQTGLEVSGGGGLVALGVDSAFLLAWGLALTWHAAVWWRAGRVLVTHAGALDAGEPSAPWRDPVWTSLARGLWLWPAGIGGRLLLGILFGAVPS